MSAPVYLALLLLGTLAWTLLPLVPAFLELYRRTDVEPLYVPKYYQADTRYFARTFREHIRRELAEKAAMPDTSDLLLASGTPVYLTHEWDSRAFAPAAARADSQEPMVYARSEVAVPGGATLAGDIYATGDVEGGARATYRALYGDQDVTLGAGSVVLRWIHADGSMRVGSGTMLCGRASSETLLELAEGSQFERLYAPEILFGPRSAEVRADYGAGALESRLEDRMQHGAAILKDDYELPAGSFVLGDIVCRGRLVIGRGSVVYGSLKAHAGLELRDGVRVHGSLVCIHAISIGASCSVGGPVISECEIYLAPGAAVGTIERPATLTARTIYTAPGTSMHGTVWARELGLVTPLAAGAT